MLDALVEAERWPDVAALLTAWVPRQRWFAGKARQLTGLEIADAVLIGHEGADPTVLEVIAEISYADGSSERYQVPLVTGTASSSQAFVGSLDGLELSDATADPEASRLLVEAVLDGVHRKTSRGALVHGEPVGERPILDERPARRLGVEQSNTSVVLSDRVIVKLFRKLEQGLNPDVELTRGLTEHGFAHVPAQHGALLYSDDVGTSALGVVSEFISGAPEGWAIATAEAEQVRDGALAPDEGRLRARCAALGEVVGRMHLALRDVFGDSRADADDGESWAAGMRAQADRVLAVAEARGGEVTAGVLASRAHLAAALSTPAHLDDLGTLCRIHGDLHLGQILLDDQRGWIVLDFEGEPARSLADRRLPHSPLRDAAGMLRSFDYAVGHADPASSAALDSWRDGLRDDFLAGYLGTLEGTGLLPSDEHDRTALMVAFELDKATYELGYELANRPSWTRIPAGGIRRLLGQTEPDRQE